MLVGPYEQMVFADLIAQKGFVADNAADTATEEEMVAKLVAAYPNTTVNQPNLLGYYIFGLWADGLLPSPTFGDFKSWVAEVGPQTVKEL